MRERPDLLGVATQTDHDPRELPDVADPREVRLCHVDSDSRLCHV